MNKTTAKKYLSAIKASKIRNLTCESLSRSIGIYPEAIAENLSYFEPMLLLDMSTDLRELVPAIESYIEEIEKTTPKKEKKIAVNSIELKEYKSVQDFVYRKMTINGLVSKNIVLSKTDLEILGKLVEKELKSAKTKKRK